MILIFCLVFLFGPESVIRDEGSSHGRMCRMCRMCTVPVEHSATTRVPLQTHHEALGQ